MRASLFDQSTRDAFFSAWKSGNEVLEFRAIAEHLVKKGIIKEKNKMTLSRWLKKLESEKSIERVSLRGGKRQGYKLKLKPKDYQMFDYLNELRKKYEGRFFDSDVGSFFSKICNLSILGFPKKVKDEDESIALFFLLTRIGEIFAALESLRNVVVQRSAGLNAPMNDTVNREVFFAILKKNMEEEGMTEELVERYRSQLEQIHDIPNNWSHDSPYKKTAINYFKPKESLPIFIENLCADTSYLKEILHNIEGYKHGLKIEGFDVDKHQLLGPHGLFARYKTLVERMEKGRYKAEEVENESQLRIALLLKVAENIRGIDTDLDDFAIILTRHPFTMDSYNTAENSLYDSMKWVSEGPPKDALLNRVWLREKQQHKTNEGMIASRLLVSAHFGVDEYRNLRNKPWVIKEFRKIANFDETLKIYEDSLIRKFNEEKQFLEAIREETKGKKPIELTKEFQNSSIDI